MEQVVFEIAEVRHGWFVCLLAGVEVWCSGIWRHDGAGQLLRLVRDVLGGEIREGYAVLPTEPGAYVLWLRGGLRPELALWYTGQELPDWYCGGDDAISGAPPVRLRREERLLLVQEPDLYGLARSVVDAFDGWTDKRMRDTYDKNWMPFPEAELRELRLFLGDIPEMC